MVTAGWLMARSALAARARLSAADGGSTDEAFLRSKVTTARFFCERLLLTAVGLLPLDHRRLRALDGFDRKAVAAG